MKRLICDPGVINFCYAVLQDTLVTDFNISKIRRCAVIPDTVALIREAIEKHAPDEIIVELQLWRNKACKEMEIAIRCACCVFDIACRAMSARTKFNVLGMAIPSKHRERKKAMVNEVERRLAESLLSLAPDVLDRYRSLKKKDDLCDCIMMGLSL